MSADTVAIPTGTELSKLLEEIRSDIGVPGVSMCIASGDEWVEGSAGVANIYAEDQMRSNTLFLIGSISKIFTTSVVLRLAEQGLIDIDKSITHYLPDLTFADPTLAEEITVWRLLDHSSGLDGGDYCIDRGRGDDALRLYVDSLAGLGRLYDPGDMTSYCNAAFVIVGYIAEVVSGTKFNELQQELLLTPLGLTSTVWTPEDAMLLGAATGSYPDGKGGHSLPPHWNYPWAAGPCGTSLTASAHDLVAFARMHLRGGVAEDGTRILSQASVDTMQVPRPVRFDTQQSFGLGWRLGEVGDVRSISHGGGSPGGTAMLQAIPDNGVTLAVFCNGEDSGSSPEVARRINERLFGIEIPSEPEPVEGDIDLEPFTGTFARWGTTATVTASGGGLKVVSHEFAAMKAWLPRAQPDPRWETTLELKPTGPNRFGTATFIDKDGDGTPEYYVAGRASRRV
jgi:CubicO group peptidase (beta-lactamase class C family)